jgi:hypothetical protein
MVPGRRRTAPPGDHTAGSRIGSNAARLSRPPRLQKLGGSAAGVFAEEFHVIARLLIAQPLAAVVEVLDGSGLIAWRMRDVPEEKEFWHVGLRAS